jgi:hypothetical protein
MEKPEFRDGRAVGGVEDIQPDTAGRVTSSGGISRAEPSSVSLMTVSALCGYGWGIVRIMPESLCTTGTETSESNSLLTIFFGRGGKVIASLAGFKTWM